MTTINPKPMSAAPASADMTSALTLTLRWSGVARTRQEASPTVTPARTERHALVVTLDMQSTDRPMLEAWVERGTQRTPLRSPTTVTLETVHRHGALHVDVYEQAPHTPLRVLSLSIQIPATLLAPPPTLNGEGRLNHNHDACRVLYARTPLLLEAGLGSGRTEPPTVHILPLPVR